MAKRKKQKLSGKTDRPSYRPGASSPQWKYARFPAEDADWLTWYRGSSEGVRGKFDQVLDVLEQNRNWHLTGYYQPLRNGDGLGEIKVKEELQWRFFGFFGLEPQEYTVTVIGYHKETDYEPRDAIKTGKRRMRDIRRGIVQRIRCVRPTLDDDDGDA